MAREPATLGQMTGLGERFKEVKATRTQVQRLLEYWPYVCALLRAKRAAISADQLRKLLAGKLVPAEVTPPIAPWISIWEGATPENSERRLLQRESDVHKRHSTSWNYQFYYAIIQELGIERIRELEEKYYLRFSALPEDLDLTPEAEIDWWEEEPEDWFYRNVEAGKIGRLVGDNFKPDKQASQVHGQIVLIDARPRPFYLPDNEHEWEADEGFCGHIIRELRKTEKISAYPGHPSSRFKVSAQEWQECIQPELARFLGFRPEQVRLERAIEESVIHQLFDDIPRDEDGEARTEVWLEDGSIDRAGRLNRLWGGDEYGGISSCIPRFSSTNRSFRPIIVLSPLDW